MVRELMEETNSYPDIKIFATDLNVKAIEVASSGLYLLSIAVHLEKEQIERHFENLGDSYKVKDNLRKMVIFCPHNVIKDPPFNQIDLFSCRNLLIYLNNKTQGVVLNNFHYSLSARSGMLMLGNSEDIGALPTHFEAHDGSNKLYTLRSVTESPLVMNTDNLSMRSDSERRVGETHLSSRANPIAKLVHGLQEKFIQT